ncbi:MAG: Uma2 family endonuclease [Anaerolineae bacterium]|nr:Uma2 family endonuclease [Anaerolineae bacterium]
MSVQPQQPQVPVSWQEFEQFFLRPENASRSYEYIDREIVEVTLDSLASVVGANIVAYVGMFVMQQKLGYLTGANGGYRLGSNAVIPSCAFVPKERRPTVTDEYYSAVVPAFVVEVKARGETYLSLLTKVVIYLKHGVNIVWLVQPEKRRVEVFTSTGLAVAGFEDALDGGAVLPGFTIKVKDLFAGIE